MGQEPVSGVDYERFYANFAERVTDTRSLLGRPLTLADKILAAHCDNIRAQEWRRGEVVLRLRVDRVAMQDATAQMALLQFMQSGRLSVAVPSTVHCDHLVRAETGVREDTLRAIDENAEVYGFLRSATSKYGIGFWRPGSGIIHQVVLENYAFPGGLMIGTDSHTPNAGGLGMIAVGVGGADAAETMAGLPWEVLHPKTIGVHLTGKLSGWTSAKDVITYLCTLLTVKGGTNRIIEYFGEGAESISATGKATICNMGAELGATASVFPFDESMLGYLAATGRQEVFLATQSYRSFLRADAEVLGDPAAYYDEVIKINLDLLEPHIVGPHSPDRGRPISKLREEVRLNGWPAEISSALIGSCTNSSYEDVQRAAHLAEQAMQAGLRPKTEFLVSPGSDRVFQTVERDGFVETLRRMGATVLANACGPCIGQWSRGNLHTGKPNTIVSSFNRNFPARNDGNPLTYSFITSPEMVVAFAFAGTLDFDPMKDEILSPDGTPFQFQPPIADAIPRKGFMGGTEGYEPPSEYPEAVRIEIDPENKRLQLLKPFDRWDGKDFVGLPILVKTRGKTTTDHISPAGHWLQFRGHLDRISDNMLLGALNAFTGETGMGTNRVTGIKGRGFSLIAREFKSSGFRWVIIGDENYGEGSSREHAAMSPRHLGCAAVIAKSFARIHETNLKKQGILPLTFLNPTDYELFQEDGSVSIVGLSEISPGKLLTIIVEHANHERHELLVRHGLTHDQIKWFQAGSALNAAAELAT